MATVYTSDSLRDLFQSSFNLTQWYSFLQHFFNASELKEKPERIIDSTSDEGYYLGSINTADSYRIGLFHYNIRQGTVAHKKVGLRKLVKQFVNPTWGQFDAALVVFDSGDHWRLSFVCDIKDHATAPKRFTFVFGEKENFYRTAIERFLTIQNNERTFNSIREAFSVEALSDDFFVNYRELYADFVQYISGKRYIKSGGKWEAKEMSDPNYQFSLSFGNDEKLVRDYIKKLFGRIVFLYFLQRKGWLNGDRQYMHNLFNNSSEKDNFLDGVLEPLFFEVLNTDKRNRTDEANALPGSEGIPYLNGGLFARDEIDEVECVFPEDYFKKLFDFLDSYNFTIDENDSDDAEIGIDPEMLGRIFENLLEDNKDKGAFYTPKEIVNYMCRESIIAFLQNDADEQTKPVIRKFVEHLDVAELSDKQKYAIRKKLQGVKVCDPAIGSGAFPMGLVNLLSKLYVALKEDTDTITMKRYIMQNNIYGVDIEKGAVDIARLRFWLAMIVEEKEPMPLPNLHFKIMQGNSLLESVNGLDLSDLTDVKGLRSIFDSNDYEREDLKKSLALYYNTSDHIKRDKLFNDIIKNVRRQIYDKDLNFDQSNLDPSANTKFFLWHTWFADVFDKGGFDIVIGNPPYIQLQKSTDEKAVDKKGKEYDVKLGDQYVNAKFDTFEKTGDIYCLFYEIGNKMLKSGGHLCFITSNKWMRAGYGGKMREYLVKNTNPKLLIDFAGVKVFESATVDTNILLFSKAKNEHRTVCAVASKHNKDCLNNLSLFVEREGDACDFTGSDSWVILSPIERSIKRKIEAAGTPLKDWDIQINYGIKTGFNKAFIISTEKRDEILGNCQTEEERKKTEELIRPILRGRDIKRYGYEWADLWLIATFPSRHYNIEEFPAVKAHLLSFGKERLEQTGKKYIISGEEIKARKKTSNKWFETQDSISYWEDFYKPKIMYSEIVREPQFYLDKLACYYPEATTFIMTGSNIEYLCKLFHTNFITFVFKKYYAGGGLGDSVYRYKKQFFEKLPVPIFKGTDIQELLVHSTNSEEIEFLCYKLYELNDSEIAFISSFDKSNN